MLERNLWETEEPGSNPGAAIYCFSDAGWFITQDNIASSQRCHPDRRWIHMKVLFKHHATLLRDTAEQKWCCHLCLSNIFQKQEEWEWGVQIPSSRILGNILVLHSGWVGLSPQPQISDKAQQSPTALSPRQAQGGSCRWWRNVTFVLNAVGQKQDRLLPTPAIILWNPCQSNMVCSLFHTNIL